VKGNTWKTTAVRSILRSRFGRNRPWPKRCKGCASRFRCVITYAIRSENVNLISRRTTVGRRIRVSERIPDSPAPAPSVLTLGTRLASRNRNIVLPRVTTLGQVDENEEGEKKMPRKSLRSPATRGESSEARGFNLAPSALTERRLIRSL